MHNRLVCLVLGWLAILLPWTALGCSADNSAGAGGSGPCNDSTSASSSASVSTGVVTGVTTGTGDTTTSVGSGDGGTVVYPECQPGETRLVGKEFEGPINLTFTDSLVDAELSTSLRIDWPNNGFMFFDWLGVLEKSGDLASVRGAVRFPGADQIQELKPGSTIVFFADPTHMFVELANFHAYIYPDKDVLGCMRHAQ